MGKGKRNKELKKKIWPKNMDQRTPSYNIIERAVSKLFKGRDGKQTYHDVKMGQRVCGGLRAKYLKLKKDHKSGVCNA